jgi:hypothetical protein
MNKCKMNSLFENESIFWFIINRDGKGNYYLFVALFQEDIKNDFWFKIFNNYFNCVFDQKRILFLLEINNNHIIKFSFLFSMNRQEILELMVNFPI